MKHITFSVLYLPSGEELLYHSRFCQHTTIDWCHIPCLLVVELRGTVRNINHFIRKLIIFLDRYFSLIFLHSSPVAAKQKKAVSVKFAPYEALSKSSLHHLILGYRELIHYSIGLQRLGSTCKLPEIPDDIFALTCWVKVTDTTFHRIRTWEASSWNTVFHFM